MGVKNGERRKVTKALFGVLAVGLACALPASASATELPSTISSNLTLTQVGGPYSGSSTIEAGATLTIEPGVEFTGGALGVYGTLDAKGTAEEPIVFGTSSFGQISFQPGSSASVLDHVEMNHGGTVYDQAIMINKSSPRITNSTIRDSYREGITIKSGSPEIDHNRIIHSNGNGISYTSSESPGAVDIHDNVLEENNGTAAIFAGVWGGTSAISMGGNTLKNNESLEAIYYNGYETGEVPPDIGSNILSENVGNHVYVSGVLTKSATWYDGAPLLPAGFVIGKEATLTVEPGTVLEGGLSVKGTLKAEGTTEEPVIFKRHGTSEMGGITFKPGSGASLLDHVEVDEGGTVYNQAILIEESSPRITNSTVRDSTWYGITIKSGAPEIDHNKVIGSTENGISYTSSESAGTVDIHDNVLEENGGSAAIFAGVWGGTSALSLGGNTLKGNSSLEAIYYNGYGTGEVPPDICSNHLSENNGDHINVSGTIKESGTCEAGGYSLWAGITVAKGVTWTLGPGLVFEGGEFIVEGTLKAEGTAKEPIVFRPHPSQTWGGLTFTPSSGASLLDHVEVNHGGPYWGASITINDASPAIVNSTIRSSAGYGIFIKHGGAPDIGYNHIEDSVSNAIVYGEVEGHSGEIDIHDNVLERNGGSAALFLGTGESIAGGTLSGNTLRENSSLEAIYFRGGEVPTDLTENKLIANKDDNIDVSGTVTESGTWSDPGGPINVSTLTIAPGATLTIQPGVAFEGGEFVIKGTLKAIGTEEEPILFDPPGSSSWAGLVFEAGSGASQLEYVEVVKGGTWSGEAIAIKGASPSITNSTIRESNNYGIYVTTGAPTIEGSRFRKNPYAIVHEGEGKVSAPNNDWGCKGGPGSSGCDSVWNVEWKPATTLPELPHPCVAGSSQPGPNLDCLLYRYAPELKYDSQESYLANSAAEITDNWGDESGLWGESENDVYSNKLITDVINEESELEEAFAYSRPSMGGTFHLTLDSLGEQYPNTLFSQEDDRLDEAGEDYAEDDHNLVAKGYLNRSYARVINGAEGKVWLQYWYFYYYNSFEVGDWTELHEGGIHEGDWEEIQVGLDKELKPETVILSAHGGGQSCSFEALEKGSGEGPAVYVALDSHANYPQAGTFELFPFVDDHANGEGPAITPSIEVIGQDSPSWVAWGGHWGNSGGGPIPGEAESPQGPLFHAEWYPDEFAEGAGECEVSSRSSRAAAPDVAAPVVSSADFKGEHPSISYELPGGGRAESGSRLILSVKEKGSKLPPLTKTVKRTKAEGEVTLPFELNPERDVVVLASVVDRFGNRSQVVRRVLAAS